MVCGYKFMDLSFFNYPLGIIKKAGYSNTRITYLNFYCIFIHQQIECKPLNPSIRRIQTYPTFPL